MAGEGTIQEREWVLTEEAFARLLMQLGRDTERAAEKYENIRRKLITFFKCRGCLLPEEYADKTIDRVARRLDGGAEMRVSDPYLYFHGVALNVLKEYWRDAERDSQSLDQMPDHRTPYEDPDHRENNEAEKLALERRLECMESCLTKLSPKALDMIVSYYQGEGANKERRRRMAEALNATLNSLKIRVYRIKVNIERCVSDCLEEKGKR